jgi:hypothetical protein
MYAISWHDPARIPETELRQRGMAGTPEEIAGYFHLAYRMTADAVVVASSGWPQPGWSVLPNPSVLAVDPATLEMSVLSLDSAPTASGRVVGSRHGQEAGHQVGSTTSRRQGI